MGNSRWTSPFGLWASKHFLTCGALLKPFDHVTSEVAMFTHIDVCTGRCERERQGAEASCPHDTTGGVCRTTLAREKTPTIKQKSENETTAGQRPLVLLWELSNSSYKSLPHHCQDRATWKLAAGSSPHWNLVQGLMSAFYSMGNNPSYTETTQNKGIHSTWWAALTKQDWHQGSTTKPQAAVHGHDFHKPMRDWRVWGYLPALCVSVTILRSLET